MLISTSGVELVKHFEGFSAKPYLCPAGVATIGYGNTFYADGRAVQLTDSPITKTQAEALLLHVLNGLAVKITARLPHVKLTQGQLNALASFAYNMGLGKLAVSTLWDQCEANDMAGAAQQFSKWIYANGRVLAGLQKRRAAEKLMFMQH